MITIINIQEIIDLLNNHQREFVFYGEYNTMIDSFSSIYDMESNSVSWIKKGIEFDEKQLLELNDVLIITNDESLIKRKFNNINIILCENPRDCFFSILGRFFPKNKNEHIVAHTAVVRSNKIHPSVSVGNNSFIDSEVIIEEGTVISSNVTIEGNVFIGKNNIIQSGVVIGSDGFGYYKNFKNENEKIEHYGRVVIGNHVEIGANTCIDKGTFNDTIIKDNVKLGNLCQISHNVVIERNVLIASHTSVLGSTKIEKDVYIAPNTTIRNKIILGEGCFIGLGSVVVKNVEKNNVMIGVPAKKME